MYIYVNPGATPLAFLSPTWQVWSSQLLITENSLLPCWLFRTLLLGLLDEIAIFIWSWGFTEEGPSFRLVLSCWELPGDLKMHIWLYELKLVWSGLRKRKRTNKQREWARAQIILKRGGRGYGAAGILILIRKSVWTRGGLLSDLSLKVDVTCSASSALPAWALKISPSYSSAPSVPMESLYLLTCLHKFPPAKIFEDLGLKNVFSLQ